MLKQSIDANVRVASAFDYLADAANMRRTAATCHPRFRATAIEAHKLALRFSQAQSDIARDYGFSLPR